MRRRSPASDLSGLEGGGNAVEAGATYEHISFYERRLDHESILSRSGRAMAHDEEQERHSAVKQKPVDSLKNHPFLGGGAPPGFCRLRDGCGECSGGVRRFLRGAPLNIYPDWRGLGMQLC
jgi:hypothetical protein